jgi:FtsH-binding integral membrane protein
MKPSTRDSLLILIGGVFGCLGLFHSTLGLPEWTQIPFGLVFLICVWTVVWLQRRAKRRGDPTFVPATPAQNRRQMWLLLVVLLVSCVASPFFLPYTGITSPFGELVVISAVVFIVFAFLIILIRRHREKA